jgi:hypothetical protein
MKVAIGIGGGAGMLAAQFIIGGFAATGHPLSDQTGTLLTQALVGIVGLAFLGYGQYHNVQKNKTIASLAKTNNSLSNQVATSSLNIPTGVKK